MSHGGTRVKLDGFGGRHAERAAAIAAGRVLPAVPRDAATVVVLRAAGNGVEVLMLKRPAAMAFAAGAYVFPGGSVDAADADPGIGWHGPSPAEFGELLGEPPDRARALVCAAVRETFEEAGVLLAGTPDRCAAIADGPAAWEADRVALAAGELTFAGLLARRGLVIRADLLTPWARWITPEAEPRRFDARFFAAALPPGQRAVGHAAEADSIAWLRPGAAIEAARAGEIMLMVPTATTLNELTGGGVTGILARRRTVTPVQPRVVLDGGQAWLLLPEEADYPL